MKYEAERSAERQAMVDRQLRGRGITDSRVLAAMSTVPRHRFVPPAIIDQAYNDCPLPIGEGQTISQPYIVALMALASGVKEGDRVLEIGTGSGYGAAILAQLAQEVYTVERLAVLSERASLILKDLGCENVHCFLSNGSVGLDQYAPYDVIVVTASAPQIPESLKKQLAIGGTMIIPVGGQVFQELCLVRRTTEEHFTEEVVESVRFVPLIGTEGW